MSFEDWMFVIAFSPIVVIVVFIELILRFLFSTEEELEKVEQPIHKAWDIHVRLKPPWIALSPYRMLKVLEAARLARHRGEIKLVRKLGQILRRVAILRGRADDQIISLAQRIEVEGVAALHVVDVQRGVGRSQRFYLIGGCEAVATLKRTIND